MRYLVIGPAAMGIFSLIGCLKSMENNLTDVEEISGSSAGAIITLLMALGMSLDEIFKLTLSIDVTKLMKIKITSFYNNFGFVDMEPIRKKLVEMCKCDPTFKDIDMKIYISAFCLNTSETVYFSKDTHPDMKVIDAVCMSMAVPVIFSCGKYKGNTYIDGGTMEQYPLAPFLDKKPHEITCIKIKLNKIFKENISNPKEFIEALILSTLSNRTEYDKSIEVVEVNVEDTDIFNFSMTYEEKIRLFNMGYLK
jgi:NTE family protein